MLSRAGRTWPTLELSSFQGLKLGLQHACPLSGRLYSAIIIIIINISSHHPHCNVYLCCSGKQNPLRPLFHVCSFPFKIT